MLEDKLKYQKQIGNRIWKARKELGITIDELAERVGISSGYLGLIERGKRCTTARRLNKFAHTLGVTPNYLLQGEVENKHTRKDELLHKCMNFITDENCYMYNMMFSQLSGYNLNETETMELCDFTKAALKVISKRNNMP